MHASICALLFVLLAYGGNCNFTSFAPQTSESLHLSETSPTLDPSLLHDTYTSTFRLRDGSSLVSVGSTALDAMRGSVERLLAVGSGERDWLNHTRSLPDDRLLRILLLAVAGNFTVDQSPTALPQRCGIVVDPGTGALVLRDNAATQSVILEVLLIVSIVSLVRAWGGSGKSAQ